MSLHLDELSSTKGYILKVVNEYLPLGFDLLLEKGLLNMNYFKYEQSVKHFLGPKKSGNQDFFPQKLGGYQEFFSIKSNDFIQNYK